RHGPDSCERCRLDSEFLRSRSRPNFEDGRRLRIRVCDLFCGCGGMTLGYARAALDLGRSVDVALAVDNDPVATAVFKANFPHANVATSKVEALLDRDPGSSPSPRENDTRAAVGTVDVLLGGPPCQG